MGARAVAEVAKTLWPPLDYHQASFDSPHTQHDAEKYLLCCSRPEQKSWEAARDEKVAMSDLFQHI